MKTYKILRTYLPVGNAGDTVTLGASQFTTDLLNSGIIAEHKIIEPTEKKARTRKSSK